MNTVQSIEKISQLPKCRNVDEGSTICDDPCTGGLIEHPAGHLDQQLRLLTAGNTCQRLNSHNYCGLTIAADSPQYHHVTAEERVVPIDNSRRPQLAGSVWMR